MKIRNTCVSEWRRAEDHWFNARWHHFNQNKIYWFYTSSDVISLFFLLFLNINLHEEDHYEKIIDYISSECSAASCFNRDSSNVHYSVKFEIVTIIYDDAKRINTFIAVDCHRKSLDVCITAWCVRTGRLLASLPSRLVDHLSTNRPYRTINYLREWTRKNSRNSRAQGFLAQGLCRDDRLGIVTAKRIRWRNRRYFPSLTKITSSRKRSTWVTTSSKAGGTYHATILSIARADVTKFRPKLRKKTELPSLRVCSSSPDEYPR